jgi:hypothetical protein
MSVIKLSRKDIYKNGEDDEKIKIGRDQISYDSAMVSAWETGQKQAATTLDQYRERINSGGFLSSKDISAYRKALDSYVETSGALRGISKSFGQSVEDDDTWSSNISQMESGFKGISDYYSKWKTEEDFKVAMEQAKANEQRMAELTNGYDPAKNQQEGKAGWDAYVAYQKERAKKIKNTESAPQEKSFGEKLLGYIGDIGSDTSLPGLGGSQVRTMSEEAQRKDLNMRQPDERWNDEQREIFGYLWNTQRQKASEYAFAVNNMLNKQAEDAKIKEFQESATDNFFAGAGHTLGAIASAPLGLADYLGDIISLGAVGYIPQADGEITPFEYSQAVTSGVSQHLNEASGTLSEDIPIIGGKGLGDVYGLGTSIAQSSLAAYSGGSGQALITFFGSAAASGVDDALSRGASGEQAIAYGTLSGLAEGLAENIGVDNLLNIGASNTMRELVMNLLKQGTAEGLEEGATTLMNNFADQLVMQDKSNFSMLVKRHMLMGLSEGDAKKQAWMDMANDLAFDMVSGFASGAIHAAPQTAYQTYRTGREMKSNYGGSQQELVGEALEIDPDNAFAQKMQGRLDSGKQLSGAQLNRLVQQNATAITAQDMTTIQNAAESRLTELGETGDVSAIAAALTKQSAGEKLSRTEQKLISDSKYGSRVANELNPENIQSGEYSSEWAQKLDTNRINAEEYSRLVEASQLPQETAEATGGQVATEAPKVVQTAQAEPAEATTATIRGNQTVEQQPESQYEVSAKGKAELGGKEVVLNGFRKAQDGSVMVATADNQTADPSEVKYPSNGHALVYESYANIETTAGNPVIANMDVDTRSVLARAYNPANGVAAKDYILGSNQAYWYGFEGIPMNEKTLPKNSLIRSITEEQRSIAYDLGRKAGKQAAQTQEAGIQKAYEKAVEKLGGKEAAAAVARKNKGTVVLEDKIRESTMTKKQKASYELAKIVSEAVGTNIHIYHGMKEYGRYDPDTGDIWLNINGNFNGSSMMAFTLAHELVHTAKQWKPADFKAFADYLLEQYGKKGVSVEALIQAQMANAKANDYTLDEHTAYEEVIADACQRMLLDSDAVQKMAAYKEQNPSKWQQIVDAIKKFIDKIRKVFAGAEPDSMEAALYKEFDDDAKQFLEKLFVDMVMGAGEHMSTIRNAFGKGTVVEVNADGEFTLAKGEDANGAKKFLYNAYTWERGGRDTLKAALEAEGYSKEDIKAALTIMDGKHKMVQELAEQFPEQDRINQATITTDLKSGHSVLSALVSNGDYPVNIDLLMVCKKRKAYQRVINRLCETGLIQQATVDALAIAEINKILGKYGFETACLGCFVESRRLRIQEWANTIVKEWNAEVKKRNPDAKAFGFGKGEGKLTPDEVMQLIGELESGGEKNDKGNLNLGQGSAVKRMGVLLDKVPSLRKTLSIEDLITPDGLTRLREVDSNLFSMVKSRYGSNSPKFVQEFNPYNHELAMYGKVPSEYKSMREYLYAIGGARMQSFSDFIVENWFDYCQIVADLAARKLPMHTYTKEIALAKLFGQTGIKINMSLIPDIDRSLGREFAGLTRNEKGELELIWADKDRFKATGGKSYMQSINFADAIALQNDPRYSANVGTIAVGVSDKHILTMLDDARVRMIIPYHSSGMNPIFADLMGTSYYKDYTMFQNTTVKQLYNSKGQPVSVKLDKIQTGKLTSGFQFNEVLQELGDARAAAQAYKDWCADASKHTITIKGETYTAELTPKFDSFSWHDNYYKLLEDFNTYDSISEEAAPQSDVQQIYPEDFDQILKGELTAQEAHRQKQAENQAFDKAMGEIESYLQEHTKADTVFYAEQNGVKLSAKDKKLGAEDKKKLADLRKGAKYSMPKVHTDAVEKFGTTTDFEEAGFILPSGEMLKFTDEKHRGERQYDHRAIGMVYGVDVDLSVNHGFNKESGKFLDEFVENGGIRFDAGHPSLNMDIGLQLSSTNPLTKAQEQIIRDLVEWKSARESQFESQMTEDDFLYRGPLAIRIDFGGDSNYAVGSVSAKDLSAWGKKSLEYEGGNINADRIIADIRNYYQTGEIRKPSRVAQFRYSMPKVKSSPTYEELVAKKPIAVIGIGQNEDSLSYAELKDMVMKDVRERKIFDFPHPNRDTKVMIFLTEQSFTHAFSNLTSTFGEDTILAMGHIPEIIHEAVLTHIAPPKNPNKAESRVFTFFAAIDGKNGIEPVKLTVKEYSKKEAEEFPANIRKYFEEHGEQETHNRLYDAEVLEVISIESAKKESGASASDHNRVTRFATKGTPNSTIKIADLLGLVNGEERKYIPLPAGTDAGYHAGDLGKAEFLHQQGYGRDTGHFGTGTYFVGAKELIEDSGTYASRPHHAVNFGDYNLYKIRNDDDGYKLHRSLRVIDGGFSQEFLDAAVADKFAVSELWRDARELAEKYDTKEWDEEVEIFLSKDYIGSAIRAYTEVAKDNGLDIQSYDEWLSEQAGEVVMPSDPDYNYYKGDYLDYLKDTLKKTDADRNNGYSKFRDAYFDLWLRFGIRGKDVAGALRNTLAHQNSFSDSDIRVMSKKNGVDSLATVFMKSMGYEGIDVRGTGLDNVGYGSVIYDLNPSTVIYKTPNSRGMSPRQLLADAFDDLVQTSKERELMDQYRSNIAKVEEVQGRLRKLRAEISKQTKAKGDKSRIAEMNKTAKGLADLIDKYDRILLDLEASKPLKDVLARARSAAYQEAKQRNEKTMKEYRQQVSERFDRGVEGRRKTEMRKKIRKVIRDLDKILNRGDKKRNVKEDMKDFVAEALSAAEVLFTDNYTNEDIIRNGFGVELSKEETKYLEEARGFMDELANLPAGGYDAWQARQEAEETLKSKLAYRMSKLKDAFFRERQRLNKAEVAEVLGNLADAYAKLETSEYAYVNGAYHEAVYEYLKMLQEDVGGAKVRDMTLGQLEELYKAYTMVLTTVQNANKMFAEDLKQSKEELANRVMMEVHQAGGEHGLWSKGQLARNQASWNNTKPIYAAERTGSATFVKLVKGLFKGQYNWATDMEEAKAFRQEVAEKYGFKAWDMEKTYKFTSSSGIDFELNLNQIMSLYAYAKREQAHDHLLKGGFVFGKNTEVVVTKNGIKRTYLNKSAKAHNISDEIMGEIIGKLTKEQKGFVDEMQDYLSTTMGGKGNEVSLKLYGVKLFMEKFYFPLRSAGQFKEKAKEAELKQQQGQISIANSGFTKAVTPKASNPVVLDGFTDVWASHVNEMSMYHSMVLPMEDFRRVYNYASPNMEGQESASVNSTIENAYGDEATGYFDQLYKELNGGAIVDPREDFSKKLIGRFKKSSVMLSNSVWVQQFSAIGRAYALIDPKHFIGPKIDRKKHAAAWNELKQYAPVAIIKEMGGFDTHTGLSAKDYLLAEEYGKGERLKGLVKDKQYRDEIMALLPAKADELTWCAIWEATKRETKAKNPKMDVKSEEFLKKAGERFSEVIEKTQVYDSVLARSANMRSKNGLMQMLTAFMAEPTTTVNMIDDALRKGNKKTIARTFGAVAASIVLNNALVSLVYAMRDDDEDETFLEKYAQAFSSGMLDDINPMTYYPILKDIWSLFQGYDIERSDMAIYSDIADAVKKMAVQISKYDTAMDEDEVAEYYKGVGDALMSILDAGAAAFGVPLRNVRRDLMSYYNTFKTFARGGDTTWNSFVDAVGGSALDTIPIVGLVAGESNTDKLYDAIIKGDTAYVDRLKSGYVDKDGKFDQSKYNTAIRKALRENDPRIKEAAEARFSGDFNRYKELFLEIKDEGNFAFDDIMGAINAEVNKLEKKATSNTSKN